jgi:hypothetical protein
LIVQFETFFVDEIDLSRNRSEHEKRILDSFLLSAINVKAIHFFLFFDCWNELHRNRIALSLFKMRRELLSKMFACRSVVVWLICASIRSKWIYAFEVFQNRCSTCSLLICILYEWDLTCLWFACNIWFEFVINLNAN